MKILLIVLQKTGGGALDGLGFSNGLVENGFVHEAIISATNEYANKWDDAKGLRTVRRIPTFGSGIKSFLLSTLTLIRPIRLAAAIFHARPNTVHIVDFHPWAMVAYMVRPFLRYKIVYSPQDNPFDPKEHPWPGMSSIEKWFLRHADAIGVYSEFMKNDLARFLPTAKFAVLPLSAYEMLEAHAPGAKKIHMTGPLNILFFGRIEPYKGLDILIDAARILAEKKVPAKVVVAGRGNVSEKEQVAMRELGVQFENRWITDDEMRAFIIDADVVVVPYRKATQSGIISLALSYRVPVIATKEGSLPEYIKDGVNGYLIEKDPEDLAQKLKKLSEERSLLAAMSDGAARVAQEFTWKATAKKAITLYESLR